MKAEASEFAVSASEVDNYIVQWLAEVALLKRDAAHCAIFDTGSAAFSEQVREVQRRNSGFESEARSTR